MTEQLPILWSFHTSPFAGKVRAAFDEKSVDYQLHEIHPGKRPERLRELNPLNRVPALEVNGTALYESAIICEWLEDTFPEPPLWPSNAEQRACARGVAYWIDEEVTKRFFLGMIKLSRGASESDPDDIVERLMTRTARAWPVLEQKLAENAGEWITGTQFTYADIGAMAVAIRIPQWQPEIAPDPDETPLVAQWFERLRERPSSQAIELKGDPVHSSEDS